MGCAEIKLSDGMVCKVDLEDYPILSRYVWYPLHRRGKVYATTNSNVFGQNNILMHRLIMHPKRNQVVDHMNGDGLDNQKANLRCCTTNENMWNKTSKNKHGLKGVTLRSTGTWGAQIRVGGTRIYDGGFNTAKEAALAYDELAFKHFGEYANLNFPDELGTLVRRTCPHGTVLKRRNAYLTFSCDTCRSVYFSSRYYQKKFSKVG